MNNYPEDQRADRDDSRSDVSGPISPPELGWENKGGHLRPGLNEHDDDEHDDAGRNPGPRAAETE